MTKQSDDATMTSRRRLLKGMGILSGALAVGGGCPVAAAAEAAAQDKAFSPGALSPNARLEEQPFYGRHQSGIVTPQQAAMMLVAFDVLATDRNDLQRLFRLLTERIAFLTKGGQAPLVTNPQLPPMDSGILGDTIYPDNLTITVSLGTSLFDERFGLQTLKPRKLQAMTRFPNDALDASLCHGDLLLQICANTNDTVIHALRDIIKHSPDLLSVRWRREGFISDHAARSRGKETPINLLGFKDGTANPNTADQALMDNILWVGAEQDEPAWTAGGSYQAVRIIQFRVEFWDRTPLREQQTIFGREKHSGAPLGMQHEHDVPDYTQDPDGEVIPLDAHIRLANPRTRQTQNSLMLRRGYSYSLGVSNSGQLDMGLLFVCYQHDLEKGFLTVQKRLNGEALEEYIKPIGGGYFFALPGVPDDKHYLAQGLLEA
ncbi:iron uptake transporter deferrochelatase/peroxidase subunit [Erwinia sp. V71]|uniref:iron uptake transporter deferrochelatase/peroxidase subunit n=1 Tax=Erwinia sp. V71 TaxID=3369424 RepID=UPI003F5F2BF2